MAFHCGGPARNRSFADPSINFYLAPEDELVQCPYNSHKILRSRLSTHLSKCMVQYKKEMARNPKLPKFVICKYNWTHHVKEAELTDHIDNHCDDARASLLRDANSAVDLVKFETRAEVACSQSVRLSEAETISVSVPDSCDTDTTESVVSTDMESSIFCSKSEARITVAKATPVFGPPLGTPGSSAQETIPKVIIPMDSRTSTREASIGGENWEPTDEAHSVCDSHNLLEKAHIFYIPPGMTKKERKAYRERMVARFPEKKAKDLEETKIKEAKAKEAAEIDDCEWVTIDESQASSASATARRPPITKKSRKEEAALGVDELPYDSSGSVCFTPFAYDYDHDSKN